MINITSMNKMPQCLSEKGVFFNWHYWSVQVYVFNVYTGCLYTHMNITNLK